MAFPTPMYVLLKGGGYLTVASAALQTEEIVPNYDQVVYRDSPPVLPAVSSASSAAGNSVMTSTLLAPGVVGSGITSVATPSSTGGINPSATAQVDSTSSVLQDDSYTHLPPHPQMAWRTRIRWWDKASPGIARTITGTTVLNSAAVVVGSIDGLFVGQGVSGTGIAAGAIIQQVLLVPKAFTATLGPQYAPTIILSLAATAAGTVTLTIAAGSDGAPNLVGECWADRFIGWSSAIPGRS